MNKNIKDILNLFEEISNENKIFINEVSSTSNSLFGGSSVNIPVDGAHKGQSGWQSNNAWDIPAPIGSPVYAVADGVVLSYSDYGATPVHKDGKTLFGAGFTVDSSNGLPDVYYTHLKDCTVKRGDSIKCGQLLGYVMDFPGSTYDHLHIGVETGHNIKEFLNADGTLKCGGTISGNASQPVQSTSNSDTVSDTVSDTNKGEDDIETKFIMNLGRQLGLKEEKIYSKIGKNPLDKSGTIFLSKLNNSTIKTPISGIIDNFKYDRSCVNQIVVNHKIEGEPHYLQFCGITKPLLRVGHSVSKGDVLGKTTDDVTVTLFNRYGNKLDLMKMLEKETNKKDNPKSLDTKEKNKKEKDKKEKEELRVYDPIELVVLNKLKSLGNKIPSITKGGTPSIKNFYDKYSSTTKKVNENIERIKRLL